MLVAGLVLAVPGFAGAHGLEGELDDVQSRMRELAEQIEGADGVRGELAQEILATHEILDDINDQLDASEAELLAATVDLDDNLATLDTLRKKLDVSYRRLEEMGVEKAANRAAAIDLARWEYINGAVESPVFFMDAASVTDVMVRGEYLSRASNTNDLLFVRLETLEQQEDRQQELIDAAEDRQADLVKRLADTEARLVEIRDRVELRQGAQKAELDRQATILAKLDDEINHFENALEALDEDQDRIKALIRENNNPSGTTPGVLLRPVSGRVTSPFGPRVHPILGTVRMHTGIDLAGASGTNIRAAAGGRIILAGRNGGYGNTVIIVHAGGMTTLYAHQKGVNVSVGQDVKAGDVIGFVGSSGLSTGPHLHFEVRLNGNPVNPAPYL